MRPAQSFVNKLTDYDRYLTKPGFPQPPHYPIGVKWVHVNSSNVEGTVFQTFWNYKQRSCIQFITNEQVKLISFIWEGVEFSVGICYVPLRDSNIYHIPLQLLKRISLHTIIYFNVTNAHFGHLISLWAYEKQIELTKYIGLFRGTFS